VHDKLAVRVAPLYTELQTSIALAVVFYNTSSAFCQESTGSLLPCPNVKLPTYLPDLQILRTLPENWDFCRCSCIVRRRNIYRRALVHDHLVYLV